MSKLRVYEKSQEAKPFTSLEEYRKEEYLTEKRIQDKLEKEEKNGRCNIKHKRV